MREKINIFWFRRDLRLHDNHGLFEALQSELPVLPVFIFDTDILDKLNNRNDARISFIYSEIIKIKTILEKEGSSLKVLHAKPLEAFQKLIGEYDIQVVYTNKDYEPYAIQRDINVNNFLKKNGVDFYSVKDHVIFEENEILKDNGDPYTIFTPYCKRWKETIGDREINEYQSENKLHKLLIAEPFNLPELKDLGFEKSAIEISSPIISEELISNYSKTRDLPAIEGTTKLGIHLRFGTVSIRKMTKIAQKYSETFLNELIWRNFFIGILWHFPRVVDESFKPKYDLIQWRNNENEFEKWCNGETGFPMVDAGMRELNETGFMHNRVRMITASFLTKYLLIDWRWGETYFAEKLLDFELASNNGNWQWAAGTGCDAVPYFRIFNPELQQKKFDPQGKYIQKWVPEFGTLEYSQPIVEHKFARERALKTYKEALK